MEYPGSSIHMILLLYQCSENVEVSFMISVTPIVFVDFVILLYGRDDKRKV